MKMQSPYYFSHNFKLNLENGNARATDKVPASLAYFGIFFACLFVFFGCYEIFSNMSQEKFVFDELQTTAGKVLYTSLLSPFVFDVFIVALGAFALFRLVLSLLRYRKIIYQDGKWSSTYRSSMGKKRTFSEKTEAYMGVGCRVEFFQYGFVTRNRYVIELINSKESKKNIPLYITTSAKGVRKIWENYAKKLKLPAIEYTDSGLEIRQVKDLDKSLIQQHKAGIIEDKYDAYSAMPYRIAYVRKKDKIVLKSRKFWFDVFSIFFMALTFIVILFLLLVEFYLPALVLFVITTWIFCRREKLVIKPHKLVKVGKYMLFSRKENEMLKKEVKNIDVTFNPLTNRYFVAIYSDDNVIIFAKKMPLHDLRWVREFLIHEIVREGKKDK